MYMRFSGGRERALGAGRPWLLREPGSGTRTMCEDWLTGQGIEPRVLTLGSNGAIKQAARSGLGVALQSKVAVELEISLGLLETISPRGGLPLRRWHVVRSAVGAGGRVLGEPLARRRSRLRTWLLLEAGAVVLGYSVAVLRDGLLQQVDTPQRLFARPANLFVAAFVAGIVPALRASRADVTAITSLA
jgi:hypothetical protein